MTRLLVAVWLLLFTTTSIAQRVQIKAGTQLTYQVEEWGRKYIYYVTVATLNDSIHRLQWKVSGTTAYKGNSVNEYLDNEYADRLLIKPNMESLESLDEYTVRLVLPQMMNDEIENAEDTLEYGIDLCDALLAWQPQVKKVREILYNNEKVNFEYRQYRDSYLGISIGFMPYGPRNWLPFYYKDENTNLQLVEIKTTLPERNWVQ